MRKFLAALIVALFIGIFGFTTTASAEEICTTGACSIIDATKVNGPSATRVTESRVTTKRIKKSVKAFERRHNVIVAIHQRAEGVGSLKGCIDPVKRGLIRVGDYIGNTRKNGPRFLDRWERGRRICGARRARTPNNSFTRMYRIPGGWMLRGTKDNCDNRDIWIFIRVKIVPPVKLIKQVITSKTFKAFYDRYVSHTKTIEKETTSSVTYSCPDGYESIEGGKKCKKCPRPECRPIPPTPGKDPAPGAGAPTPENGGGASNPGDGNPGAGDSRTAPSAPCFALDGNNDPTIPGTWDNVRKECIPNRV